MTLRYARFAKHVNGQHFATHWFTNSTKFKTFHTQGASCLCSDFGPDKKCLRPEDCDLSKSVGSNEIVDTSPAPNIGSLFARVGARASRLFEQNDQNSIIVNKPLNPCASVAPQTVCCVPKPKTPQECPSGFIPSDDPDCPCKPESRFHEVNSTKYY